MDRKVNNLIQHAKENLFPYALLEEDDFYWALLGSWNAGHCVGLFQIRKIDWKAIYVGYHGELSRCSNYNQMLKKNGKLYFVPYLSNKLLIYDINGDIWEEETLTKDNDDFGLKECRFLQGEFFEEYLYMFSYQTTTIVCFDSVEKKVEMIDVKTTRKEIHLGDKYFFKKGFSDGCHVFFYSQIHKCIFAFDMKKKELQMLVDLTSYPMVGIVEYKQKSFWMIVEDQVLLKYNLSENKLSEIRNEQIRLTAGTDTFMHSGCVDENIMFFPGKGNCCIVVNSENNEVSQLKELLTEEVPNNIHKYGSICKIKEGMLIKDLFHKRTIIYDFYLREAKPLVLDISNEEISRLEVNKVLECVKNKKENLPMPPKDKNCFGELIWSVCKR